MQNIDTLIYARWLIPVQPADTVLENHALAIHEGNILTLLPADQVDGRYEARHVHHLDQHAVIPGLINAHTHAPMSLMRGLADDLPLMQWLEGHIWPTERKLVCAEFVHDGAQLAIAEMLRGGTTCMNDMYFFPGESARAAKAAGMRAAVNLIVIDFPSAWAKDADDYLHKGLAIHDQYRNDSLISCVFGPHAPYTVSDEPLNKIAMYADELDLQIHMHVHETAFEVEQAEAGNGERPLQRLQRLGLLSPRLLAVHMTQLGDEDIAMLAQTGTHVIHCPESNLKLASGFCPLHRLQQNDINVALGTDGAASNNDLDMFSEMRTAAQLAKTVAGDASAVSAMTALCMATINGARALGIDHITGSLEAGKAADICAVDLSAIETQPVYNPVSQLVYAAGREQVSDVWVHGRHLLNKRRLTTLDQEEVLARALAWRDRIAGQD